QCDPCMLQRLIALYCECIGTGDGGQDGEDQNGHGIGGVTPCPFPWLPLEFTYTVESPFGGQFGPLPFQDPWWKILFAIIAILLAIAAALVDILDEAHENPNIVIGEIDRFSTNNVDAALARLYGRRAIDLGVLDARTGEPHTNPRIGLDQTIPIIRTVAAPFVDMRVYKSGARTGFTHGVITHINATTDQCRGDWEDDTGCDPDPDRPNLVMTDQIRIGPDPAFPGEPTTDGGDSGSLWISNEPATQDQVVALTHSGTATTSDANPIGDVLAELGIRLTA
ncbi:MAG: S1 family peptidase, partial [Planctomycetes bacterium]|nr:S1 family peptidase [Planctomycetota bacterium]